MQKNPTPCELEYGDDLFRSRHQKMDETHDRTHVKNLVHTL